MILQSLRSTPAIRCRKQWVIVPDVRIEPNAIPWRLKVELKDFLSHASKIAIFVETAKENYDLMILDKTIFSLLLILEY